MDRLYERMIRAAKLDVNLYEEVEADKSTMSQAIVVVVISNLAVGIGRFGDIDLFGIVILYVGFNLNSAQRLGNYNQL